MNAKASILIVILSMVLMQYHSIPQWVDITESYIGIVWSLTIEILALWFWFQGRTLFAVLASSAVLASALFHLSSFSLGELVKVERTQSKQHQAEVITNVLDNIKDKKWAFTIQKTLKSLDKVNDIMKDDTVSKTKTSIMLNIVLQSLALLLIMIGQIMAIRVIKGNARVYDAKTKKVTSVTNQSNRTEYSESAIYAQQLILYIDTFKRERGNISNSRVMQLLNQARNTYTKITVTASGEKVGGISIEKMTKLKEELERL